MSYTIEQHTRAMASISASNGSTSRHDQATDPLGGQTNEQAFPSTSANLNTCQDRPLTPSQRSPSPSSPLPDVQINIEPISLRVTIVDEAECIVNYFNARRAVRIQEKVLAQTKLQELNVLNKLIRTQEALADRRLFEADKDIGRARVELTDVKKKARAELQEDLPFMMRGPEFGLDNWQIIRDQMVR